MELATVTLAEASMVSGAVPLKPLKVRPERVTSPWPMKSPPAPGEDGVRMTLAAVAWMEDVRL